MTHDANRAQVIELTISIEKVI